MSWPVGLSRRMYRVLMSVFPRRFRDRFGPEIADTFDRLAADAWETSGFRGLAQLWLKTFADLGRNGGGERMGQRPFAPQPAASPGRRAGIFETSRQDLWFAVRTVRRAPAFATAVIATIALGIGANTAIFTVVDGILLRPLPFEGSEAVVILCETHDSVGEYCVASPPNVEDWSRASSTIDQFGQARSWRFGLQDPDGTRSLSAGVATPGWFEIHGLQPAAGRLFAGADMDPGNNQVVVLANGFWRTRFAADPAIVGSTLVFDGRPFTVIGVLPEDVWIHEFDNAQIWVPLTAIDESVEKRGWRGFVTLGRLAEGASIDAAREEMETVRAALADDFPETNRGWGLRLEPLRDNVAGSAKPTLLVFLGAVGLVLLIACANVANLLLVRSTSRAQEFAVRASIGAGRLRLARQLLTESLLFACLGGFAGVLLAIATTRTFLSLAPGDIPRLEEVGIDAGVLLFALLLTGVTALLFGLAPAFSVARAELGESLKAKRSLDVRSHGPRNLLVVAELALAVMLLFGAGLLARGFTTLLDWDPGFDRDGLVMVFAIAPPDKYETGQQAVDFFERAAAELRALPQVSAVGLTSAGPLFGGMEAQAYDVPAHPAATPDERPSARYYDIGTEYFATMGIDILRGRDFEATDNAVSVPVVVVNETLARRHFGDDEVIGERIEVFDRTLQIVGVARDVRPFAPDDPMGPEIYLPKRQFPRWGSFLVLRTGGDVANLEEAARARLRALDRDFNPGSFRTLEEFTNRELVSPRFNMLLIGMFAAVALVLAAIGTYGVIAYSVASRTQEIGIRLALGARPEVILGAVIRRGMAIAGAGLALGVAGALLLSRLLGSMLYGISSADPLTLGAVTAIFALVALLACWVPARRASRLDPLEALRSE